MAQFPGLEIAWGVKAWESLHGQKQIMPILKKNKHLKVLEWTFLALLTSTKPLENKCCDLLQAPHRKK